MEPKLTERMLNKYYSDNGRVFETLEEANRFLRNNKFYPYRGIYKNKDKLARLYRLKNAIINLNKEVTSYSVEGYLVSFGGNPIGRDGHKLVKLKAADY